MKLLTVPWPVLLTLLFVSLLPLPSARPTFNETLDICDTAILNETATPTILEQRDCTPVAGSPGTFGCNGTAMSLTQLGSIFRDPTYDGRATAENHAVFYSNQDDSPDKTAEVMAGWIKSRGLENKYYWTRTVAAVKCKYCVSRSRCRGGKQDLDQC
jgi:hypothetical protein